MHENTTGAMRNSFPKICQRNQLMLSTEIIAMQIHNSCARKHSRGNAKCFFNNLSTQPINVVNGKNCNANS